jgi:hypothetical protein
MVWANNTIALPKRHTPAPSKTVLRAPPFLWNTVSACHAEPFFQGKGKCQLLFFSQPNAHPTEGGRCDGSGQSVPISRFWIALCCPVSSFFVSSSHSFSTAGLPDWRFWTPWWQWLVRHVQTRTCTGCAGVCCVAKVNGPW